MIKAKKKSVAAVIAEINGDVLDGLISQSQAKLVLRYLKRLEPTVEADLPSMAMMGGRRVSEA